MSFNKRTNLYEARWIKKVKAINILGGKCKICGEENILLLDFHHFSIDKEHEISKLLTLRWNKIETEIKKCELYCSNCHKEFHCNESERHNIFKNEILEAINRSKCEKCGHRGKNLGSLSFHHINKSKDFIISDAINRNISASLKDIYNEIEKCRILCSNCHRIEHFDQERFEKSKNIILNKKIRFTSSPIKKELVIDMIKRGMKQIEIARELKCARSTICGIFKKIGE